MQPIVVASYLSALPHLRCSHQVFTCMYAHYLGLGLDLRFTAANMPAFREKMTLSISRGTVC